MEAPELFDAGEHFIIEDLLDFPNDDDDGLVAGNSFDVVAGNSTDSSTVTVVDSNTSFSSYGGPHFSGSDQSYRNLNDAQFSGDICIPYEDLAEMEWLSNFVEESFSSDDLHKLHLYSGTKLCKDEISDTSELPRVAADCENPSFRQQISVPGKARSKRSRAAPCNWASRLLVQSPTISLSESDSAAHSAKKAGKSAPRRKDAPESGPGERQKCVHCAAEKTPQWRTGPMGPKTLCNACGVRYKSGRLVPEYRPAASPTFVLTRHSNSHRKVLELQRQKEVQRLQQQFLHPNGEYLIHHAGQEFGHFI